jgi:hypothetical protein
MKPRVIPKNRIPLPEWLQKVDALLNGKLGMGMNDLPDYEYMIAYNCGESPKEAVRDAVEYFREAY